MGFKVRAQTTIPNRPYSVNEVTFEIPFGENQETVKAMIDDSRKISDEIANQFQTIPSVSSLDVQATEELKVLREQFKKIEDINKIYSKLVPLLKAEIDPIKYDKLRSQAFAEANQTSHPEN